MIIRKSSFIVLVVCTLWFACREDESGSLPDPVSDNVLRHDHPRMVFSESGLTSFKTKLGTPQWTDLSVHWYNDRCTPSVYPQSSTKGSRFRYAKTNNPFYNTHLYVN